MLDLSHIPNSQQDIKIFYAISGSNSWQTWTKPRKCQWVWIMAIGGGGGGAGGSTPPKNAGTGGGSGAVTRATFNASHLPDTLFIQVGAGGSGGGNNQGGNPGTESTISILPSTTSTNSVLSSGTNAALGGSADGQAVTGETAFTTTTSAFGTLSTFRSVAGLGQTVGNGFGSSIDITPLTSQITCPGASGAGMGTSPSIINARSILATTISPLIQGGSGSNSPATNGGNGGNGYTSWNPFFSLGGAGGGNSVSGSGGRGGDGGIGSGGGAGGTRSSPTFGTPGRGGNGGDGLVVIVSF